MSRLTYTDEELKEFYDMDCPVRDNPLVERFCNEVCAEFSHDCPYKEMGKKLKTYEDLEEQGLLLRLPCKVGEKFYEIINGEIKQVSLCANWRVARYVEEGIFGELAFLTKEEAEQKLESVRKE